MEMKAKITKVLSTIDMHSFPIKMELMASNCGTKVSAQLYAPDRLKVHTGLKAGGIPWPPHSVAPLDDSEQAIIIAAREAVGKALSHEIDEHFKVNNSLFVDPHPTV